MEIEDLEIDNTFIINDIVLDVPPTDIVVQKEDLIYRWKSLRTSTTTKIPSGQGNVVAQVNIPFTHEMMLTAHRLIVELKANPFCYVHNRFLRQTIIPDSVNSQNMAFTVTGIHFVPMPNAADVWIMTLEMTWFNYAPFVSNLLFRRDWVTQWMHPNKAREQSEAVRLTIGWDINRETYERTPLANVALVRSQGFDPFGSYGLVPEDQWNVVLDRYQNLKQRTIHDLERMHHGEIFDLLPKPGMMEPAQPVIQPKDSLIYKRYINYLQRDALLMNFDIDVEALLRGLDPEGYEKWWKFFFSVGYENTEAVTYGFHETPNDATLARIWNRVRGEILNKMNQHNDVLFSYCLYIDVRLPPEWRKLLYQFKKGIQEKVIPIGSENVVTGASYIEYVNESPSANEKYVRDLNIALESKDKEIRTSAVKIREAIGRGEIDGVILKDGRAEAVKQTAIRSRVVRRERVRPGLTNTEYMSSILGTKESGRFSWNELVSRVTSRIGYRNPEWLNRVYKTTSFTEGRAHKGTDFGAEVGTLVYSIKPGKVIAVNSYTNPATTRWVYIDNNRTKTVIKDNKHSLYQTLLDAIPGSPGNEVGSKFLSSAQIGTIIRAKDGIGFFYKEFRDGGANITIQHKHGKSMYMHLDQIFVRVGEVITEKDIEEGKPIGTVGKTGPLREALVFEANKTQNPDYSVFELNVSQNQSFYSLGAHLHFEYWEDRAHGEFRDTKYDFTDAPLVEDARHRFMTLVDPTVSFSALASEQSTYTTRNLVEENLHERLRKTINDYQEKNNLDEDIAQSVYETIALLMAEGYHYYEENTVVQNIWWKPQRIWIRAANLEQLYDEGEYYPEGVVLTSVGGSIRHVVANIPVIGQEFPTQQHLGSIEPAYTFEFVSNDELELDGVSRGAHELEAMRRLLQSNARRFRPVVDSWTVSVNSFVTRMLGSFRWNDEDIWRVEDEPEYVDLRKRFLIARAENKTIPGHPGLSVHTWEVNETNPYEEETLTVEAPDLVDVNEARREILEAVRELKTNLQDPAKDSLLAIGFLLKELSDKGAISYDSLAISNSVGAMPGRDIMVDDIDGEKRLLLKSTAENEKLLDRWYLKATKQQIETVDLGVQEYFVIEEPITSVLNSFSAEEMARFKEQRMPIGFSNSRVSNYSKGSRAFKKTLQLGSPGSLFFVSIKDIVKQIETFDLETNNFPVSKILIYKKIIDSCIASAEMLISEDESLLTSDSIFTGDKTFTREEVSEELFGLDIEPSLWRSWQEYLLKNALRLERLNQPVGFAHFNLDFGYVKNLKQNANWLEFKEPLKPELKYYIDKTDTSLLTWAVFDAPGQIETSLPTAWLAGAGISYITDYWGELFDKDTTFWGMASKLPIFGGLAPGGLDYLGDATGIKNIFFEETTRQKRWKELAKERNKQANRNLVSKYQLMLPLTQLGFEQEFRDFLGSATQPLIGDLVGETGDSVFASHKEILTDHVWTTGHWTIDQRFSFGFITAEEVARFKDDETSLIQFGEEKATNLGRALEVQSESTNIGGVKTMWNAGKFMHQYPPGSPALVTISRANEFQKIKYIRDLLARYADEMLREPDLLRAFGLEHLGYIDRRSRLKGRDAYPDLVLPFHPYFGIVTDVTPDFYYWNLYEDGEAFSDEVVEEMEASMKEVLFNSWKSMKRLNTEPGIPYNPSDDAFVTEPGGRNLEKRLRYNAEGSDEGPYGPMASPFYMQEEDNENIQGFLRDVKDKKDIYNSTSSGDWRDEADPGLTPSYDAALLNSVKVPAPSLSNFDQEVGWQYTPRTSSESYAELTKKVNSLTQMFGSRASFLNEREKNQGVQERNKGMSIYEVETGSHKFDFESLNHLAKQSSNDIRSEKRRMNRAFPTFKLYFIEEDEQENRLVNFDDFYSYNGVVSFTYVSNRKDPADHAVITLQNVSGTLDGTKRNVITDLDYFSKDISRRVEKNESFKADSAIQRGTAQDQPFGAVVLRPGLNVQLRAGYSNDPDNLEVLINGRIVDVQWNKNGDQTEIMVQSFGTELVQVLHGRQYGESNTEVYYTTHQLLGALMLKPELQHFGRWEFNRLYMHGESKDSRLDFYEYSRDALSNKFWFGDAAGRFLLDNPVLSAVAILGGTALLSLPVFRIGKAGSLAGSLLKRAPRDIASNTAGAASGGGNVLKNLWNAATATGDNAVRTRILSKLNLTSSGDKLTASQIARLAAQLRRESTNALKDVSTLLGGKNAADYLQTVLKSRNQALSDGLKKLVEKTRKGEVVSVEELAELISSTNRNAALKLWGRQFIGDSAAALSLSLSSVKDVGFKPLGWAFFTYTRKWPLVFAGLTGAGLGLDLLQPPAQLIYDWTLGALRRFYLQSVVSMYLSPQDDNLFPPHPKDYMIIDNSWNYYFQELMGWTTGKALTAVIGENDFSKFIERHWFRSESIMSKRVSVDDGKYTIERSTIWQVFQEMGLRHPGWIWGARPYGKEFRYTMFFGVPSQRYWAQPAPEEFIYRANNLYKFLTNQNNTNDFEISQREYEFLYGKELNYGVTVEDARRDIRYALQDGVNVEDSWGYEALSGRDYRFAQSRDGYAGKLFEEYLNDSPYASSRLQVDRFGESLPLVTSSPETDPRLEEIENTVLRELMTAKALREYLRALEIRFKPFRRYHKITSEQDIVWNGIMSSENASYNAVDVTVFNKNGIPEQSHLFKAHDHLPEYMYRVMPLPQYRNVTSYQMAMRYGMGALSFALRDMYRGEILLIGNSRIRPWDICIMIDTYNDMVGPIEVEQVVHTFSHETGFITEIKPSAVVFTNEISSYPVLEALKTLCVAVEQVEDSYKGLYKEDLSTTRNMLEWVFYLSGVNGDKAFTDATSELAKARFGDAWNPANLAFNGDVPPIFDEIDERVNSYKNLVSDAMYWGGLVQLGGIVAGGAALGRAGVKPGWVATAITAGAFTGSLQIGGALAVREANAPTMAWLLGGSLLLLQALRGDSLVLVPLTKNGRPIVSGLSFHDPSMLWKSFKGDLGRYAEDVLNGGRDLLDLWSIYGMHSWRRLDINALQYTTDQDGVSNALINLTGETR